MTYWSQYSAYNTGIISAYSKLKSEKFVLVDGGAAGELSEPFDLAKSVILTARFEPRGESELLKSSNEIYIDGGLWSEDRKGTLHVAKEPTTSSICPPNIDFLRQFNDESGVLPRETQKLIEVPLRSIDSCVSNSEMPSPNFIKLDIHSSELPALLGAKNSLDSCVGLLVETWNVEVHKGQNLHYEIEKFAIENGFEVYDTICAAGWHVKHDNRVNYNERRRYIGSEMLFIKANVPRELRLEKAFVLSLFGFYSAAQNLIGDFAQDGEEQLYSAIQQAKLRSSKLTLSNIVKKAYKFVARKLRNKP
jgi:FkbM family methyltransferase